MPKIEPPYYPIVYVRGYAMRASEREETFYDTYYGFSATSVEKRQAPPPKYFEADVFEGQLIRLMKMRGYGYADAVNSGLEEFYGNASRSIWVCRFYDNDFISEKLRSIEEHAEDLRTLVCGAIPDRLRACGIDLGPDNRDYKVILIAHSMGGLVCRTLIQNLLPSAGEDPKRWIHRLVTMGTPHRGIDLGRIPDFIEEFISERLNPFDSNIFKEKRMRSYLKLGDEYDVHSLGDLESRFAYPVKRCLCIIGSDYGSYNATREITGAFSDGLVKQDRAYVVTGPIPPKGEQYPNVRTAFWANVHRAHSGRKGIVNSFESYENLQRFLFGNLMVEIRLNGLDFSPLDEQSGTDYFYDFEFALSIRKTGSYLHRRQQEPCENAMRIRRDEIPGTMLLHTFFMNTGLREPDQPYSYLAFKLKVSEHRVREGLLWDTEYPDRPIFSETLEARIPDPEVSPRGFEYSWMSQPGQWAQPQRINDLFFIPLRNAPFNGELVVQVSRWPSNELTFDDSLDLDVKLQGDDLEVVER